MDLKIYVIASAILAVGFADGNATPLPAASAEERAPRRRRTYCDLISFPLPYLNNAACATYCIASGKNLGGRCELGWCKCK